MTTDLYCRPQRERARDRRRVLMLLSAFTVASYAWIQLRFPLQRALASSNFGNGDRSDLVFETIRTLDPKIPEYSGIHWSSRSRSGPALVAVACMGGYMLVDDRFELVSNLQTGAGFASLAADRNADGCWEFSMILYGFRNGHVWFVIRKRESVWELKGHAQIELIGLAYIKSAQAPSNSIAPQWISDGSQVSVWAFHEYKSGPGAIYPDVKELARFGWTRGGALRARSDHEAILDCMPGDDFIVISPAEGIDPTLTKLVDAAIAERQNKGP
jgi:hypothetical protein